MNGTYPRYLRQNASCEMPSHFICLDTEANIAWDGETQVQTLRLGHIIYSYYKRKRWYDFDFPFRSKEHAWGILDNIQMKDGGDRTFHVIAHNLAYDWQILDLDGYISTRDMKINTRVLEPFIISVTRNGQNSGLEFLSSTNWFHGSLKEIGKIFGVEKGHVDDFENVDDETLDKYCYNDTLVLCRIMKNFIDWLRTNDYGNFAPTIAGCSFNAFRHRFMEKDSILLHRYPGVERLERDSYHGGRCEAFYLGRVKDAYKVDVNSMYPYVMAKYEYPTHLVSGPNAIVPNDLWAIMKDPHIDVISQVDLDLYEPCIGVKRDKLLFPIGHVHTTLTGPELRYVHDHPDLGRIEDIGLSAIYETKNIFKEYVDHFYKMKVDASNPSERTMAKLYLNSLYGKFGQKDTSQIRELDSENDTEDMKISAIMDDLNISRLSVPEHKRTYVRIGKSTYQCPVKLEESSDSSFPAIAAFVTAYARCYLDELMTIAGRNNVFYCDTDSLVINQVGHDNLRAYIDPNRLGALKLEETGDIEIYGSKNYSFNGHRYLKGVKHDAEHLGLDENGNDIWKMDQWNTKTGHYSRNDAPGTVTITKVVKTISKSYDKGQIARDGYVRPFKFNDW